MVAMPSEHGVRGNNMCHGFVIPLHLPFDLLRSCGLSFVHRHPKEEENGKGEDLHF